MQTIWSRAAQAKCHCRCPQCLSSVNGVSRRAAASIPQRAPRLFTSSTFIYSSIFAAAATVDAGVKQERRDQWDRVITAAKADLGQEVESSEAQQWQYGITREQPPKNVIYRSLLTGDEFEAKSRRARDKERQEDSPNTLPFNNHSTLADNSDRSTTAAGYSQSQSRWPINTGPPLEVYNLAPQSIYAAPEVKHRAQHLRWSPKKMASAHISIDLLQLSVFLRLQELGWSASAAEAVPPDYAKYFMLSSDEIKFMMAQRKQSIINLRRASPSLSDYQAPSDFTHLCSFSQDEHGQFLHSVRTLNDTLSSLFHLHAQNEITTPFLLAKLVHNISMCSAPPNVETYNTLIQGLSEAQQPFLVSRVIGALRGTWIRPNETTLASVLKHYTDTNDSNLFIRWIEMIRGKHHGLSLAREGITIDSVGRDRLVRRPDQPDKVIQLPYPTPTVFAAMITGIIKFAGFQTALKICEGMGREGWGLDMSGLTTLLDDCADRRDWTAGMAVWNQVQILKYQSRRELGDVWVSERINLPTFAAMLRLCTKCNQKQVYENVWGQAKRTHPDRLPTLVELVKQRHNKKPLNVVQSAAVPESNQDTKQIATQDLSSTKISSEDALRDEGIKLRDLRLSDTDAVNHIPGAYNQAKVSSSAEGGNASPPARRAAVQHGRVAVKHRGRAERAILREAQLVGMSAFGKVLDEDDSARRPMSFHP